MQAGWPARRRLWIAALVIWSAIVCARLFYYHTPVWPDESTFGATAHSLATGHGFATPSLEGQIPGAGRRLLWEPPLHTMLTAAAFRATGPRVESMRAISIAAALVAVIAAALLSSSIAGGVAAMITATLLVVDARFLRVAMVGRMDILAIALACLSLWQASRAAGRSRAAMLAGLFAGLAASTHPAGLIAAGALMLEIAVSRFRGERISIIAALSGLAAGLLPFAALIALDPPIFLEQLAGQMARKQTHAGSRILQITRNLEPRVIAAVILWVAIAAGLATLARHWANRAARLALFAGVLAIALNVAGPEVMYVAWLMVPAAIGLGALAAGTGAPPSWRPFARAAVIAVIAANAAYMTARVVRARSLDYPAFAAHVQRCAIDPAPAGTTLLINSIPDVYLSVADRRDRIDFRLPAPVATPEARQHVLHDLEAVLIGPIVPDPGWTETMQTEPQAWQLVPLRAVGGYAMTIAMRRGHEYPLPENCR